ncbi:Bor/Iss family lipoprotein [Sphingobacterium gobiense]|uniref:Uncharacterized protein n=1 Tax=Sphingobacterium gobiense TaxID=1382456 RepID=A0A2S9JLX8_9SPHI|nr:hypothetical protein [Sphingobacterium gobiense]PRD54144.1 hypothetical protein C5749_11690 [Sphingobacterium gobiense]
MKITLFYKLFILGLITIVLLCSCSSDLTNSNLYPPIDEKEIILHHYSIYGLLPVSKACTDAVPVEPERDCFETDRTFLNGLLSAVTLGVYAADHEFVISDELLQRL